MKICKWWLNLIQTYGACKRVYSLTAEYWQLHVILLTTQCHELRRSISVKYHNESYIHPTHILRSHLYRPVYQLTVYFYVYNRQMIKFNIKNFVWEISPPPPSGCWTAWSPRPKDLPQDRGADLKGHLQGVRGAQTSGGVCAERVLPLVWEAREDETQVSVITLSWTDIFNKCLKFEGV